MNLKLHILLNWTLFTGLAFAQEMEKERTPAFEYMKHKAGVDLISPFGKEIILHYEYLLPKQSVSIRVPLGFSYNESGYPFKFYSNSKRHPEEYEPRTYPYVSSIHNEKHAIHTGMDFLIYFNKARRVRPYIAPGVFLGMFSWEKETGIYDSDATDYQYTRLKNETAYSWVVGGEVKVGMQIMALKRVSIAIEGGAGLGKHISNFASDMRLAIRRGSFIVGYHFNGKRNK